METINKKLKTKDILGYTIGSIGDSTSYNFILSFLSFFMTTVAGVSPAVAGAIISIAIAWDAITDPIIGYIVDNSRSSKGKRLPLDFAISSSARCFYGTIIFKSGLSGCTKKLVLFDFSPCFLDSVYSI